MASGAANLRKRWSKRQDAAAATSESLGRLVSGHGAEDPERHTRVDLHDLRLHYTF